MEELKEDITEDLKFMYDKVYDELNRCRDWPLKILGFTSALYIAILGFLKLFESLKISQCEKSWLIVPISVFSIFCLFILGKQHLAYLGYRNTQIRMQQDMGIKRWNVNGKRIIPEEWDNELQ